MRILVCLTRVPDTSARIAFNAAGTALDSSSSGAAQFVIGPYDDYALSRAVELRDAEGGEVHVAHVGDADSEPILRKALAIGADKAFRVALPDQNTGLSANQVAHALAHVVQEQGAYDLILTGREASDFNQGIVAGMLSALLDIAVLTPIMRLEVAGEGEVLLVREITGGTEELRARLPLILGCQEPIAEWRIPNMRDIMTSRTKPLEVLDYAGVAADSESVGFALPSPRKSAQIVESADELVRLLREEAKVI